MNRSTCRLSVSGLPRWCGRFGLAPLVAVATLLLAARSTPAATDTWAGSAGSTDWDILADWNTLPVSGDSLIFTGANASSTNTLTDTLTSSAFNIGTITFNSGSLAYTMTGNTFTLTGGITNSSTSLETFSNTGGLSASSAAEAFTVTSGGGNITITGALTNTFAGAQTLTSTGAGGLLTLGGYTLENNGSSPVTDVITGAGNVTINGVVADGTGIGSSLTYVGTGGQLTLSGSSANTYTGLTTVTSGALILNKTSGVAAIAGNLAINGTGGNLGNVWTLANNQLGGANTVVSSVNNSGVASLTLLGTTQTVAGLSSPTGGLMVANSTTTSGTPSPSNGGTGTLILTGSGSYTDAGWIWNNWGGSGTLAMTLNMGSTGVQTLTGTENTYSGPTIVNSGTLLLKETTTFGSNVTVNPNGTLELMRTSSGFGTRAPIALDIAGTGTLNVDNTGSGITGGWVVFNNAASTLSNFSGTINVNTGVLSMDNTSTAFTGNPNLNVVFGGLFGIRNENISIGALTGNGDVMNDFNNDTAGHTLTIGANNGSGTFSGVIHGSQTGGTDGGIDQGILSLTKTGAGTEILNGSTVSTYSGGTTVNNGTLRLDFSNLATPTNLLSSSSALTMGGGTLNINGKSSGTTAQTFASLSVTANTDSSIVLSPNGGTSTTLTLSSATVTTGANASLNFNYSAGTTNGATVGNDIVVWNAPLTAGIIGNGYSVTDAGGTGFATVAGGDVVRLTSGFTPLPASGASSSVYYNLNLNSDTVTPGSLNLIETASQSVGSLTIDTTAAAGSFDLGSTTLSTTGVAITGPNTLLISGSGALGTSGSILNLHNGSTASVTIGALISGGAGGLNVDGTGTSTLTAANTYTGATIIGIGSTLQIGSAGSLGSGTYAGAISNFGTLEYSSSAAQTLSGVIGGPGGLTKDTSSSTLALTNINTFTGPLTINAGTVTLPGGTNNSFLTGNPSIIVNNGGTLSFSGFNTFGLTTSSMSAVTVNSGGTILSSLVPASNYVTVFNNLTLNSGTVSVNGNDLYAGTWGSFGFGGTTTATGTSVINVISGAGTIGNGNGQAGITAFTINTPALSDSLTISAAVQSSMALVKQGLGTLTLSAAANSYTGGTTVNSGTLILQETRSFGSGITVNPSGTLELVRTSAGFGNRAPITLAVGGTGTLNIDNATSGINGGWVLFSNPTSSLINFSGTVNVNSGVLSMDGLTGLFTGNPNLNVVSGGLFGIRGENISVGALTGNGDVMNDWDGHGAAGDTLTVGANNGSGTFSGIIHGSIATGGTDGAIEIGILNLNKSGAGIEALSGVNTYAGTTTISAGTLQIATAGSLGSGSYAGAISDNATLEYSSSALQTLSGMISGSGGLAKDTASSTLTLRGANTYNGGTTVSAGTLIVGAISDSSTSNIGPSSGPTNNLLTLGGATLQYTGAGVSTTGRNVALTGNSTIVVSGGSGAGLILTGTVSDNGSGFDLTLGAGSSGTLTLGGTNNYLGATNVNAGTLNLSGSLASTSASVAGGATLTGTGSMSSAALSVAGGGTVTLASVNSGTSLTVGSLTLGTSGTNATLNFIGGANGVESLRDLGTLTPNDIYVNITGTLAVSATPYTLLSVGSATALNNFSLSNSSAAVYTMPVGRDLYTINGGATASALTVTVSGAANPSVAYWNGTVSTIWNDLSSNTSVNWSTDSAGSNDAGNIPGPLTDVILNASNNTNNNLVGTVTTSLGGNLTINSLNVNGNRTNTINAVGNTLTINALADGNVTTELPSGNPAG